MTAVSPFHPRTSGLNAKLAWSEWATYLSPAGYADMHDIEYTAVREAAAVFDVSPLYKYIVSGPDAVRLVDRVITRDATRIQVGQVAYTPWCDEAGKVVDDGTVARLDETRFRWTAADPQYRWLGMNAAGLDVEIEDVTDAVAALALQGPRSRAVLEAVTGEEWGSLGLLPPPAVHHRRGRGGRQPHGLHGRPRLRALDPGRRGARRLGRPVRGG